MDMPAGYHHGENFLAADVYCHVDFQVAFPYMPFVPHPLAPVCNLDTGAVYRNYDIILFRFLAFVSVDFDVQPVYLLLMVVKSGMEGTFPLAWPCAIPSVCLYGR